MTPLIISPISGHLRLSLSSILLNCPASPAPSISTSSRTTTPESRNSFDAKEASRRQLRTLPFCDTTVAAATGSVTALSPHRPLPARLVSWLAAMDASTEPSTLSVAAGVPLTSHVLIDSSNGVSTRLRSLSSADPRRAGASAHCRPYPSKHCSVG